MIEGWKRYGIVALIALLWSVVMVNADRVIMPAEDLEVGKNWTGVVIVRSNDGKPLPGQKVVVELYGLPPTTYYTDMKGEAHITFTPRAGDRLEIKVVKNGTVVSAKQYVADKSVAEVVVETYGPLVGFMVTVMVGLILGVTYVRKHEQYLKQWFQNIEQKTASVVKAIEVERRAMMAKGKEKETIKSHLKMREMKKENRKETLQRYQEKKLRMRQEYMKRFEE